MIGRREAITVGAGFAGLALASPALACTPLARRLDRFDADICRSKIAKLIDFANVAFDLSDDYVDGWHRKTGIQPAYIGDIFKLGTRYLKQMRLSDGKVDPRPMDLTDVKLLRKNKLDAIFAFTLRREKFLSESEGCNGLYSHSDMFVEMDEAYVASFESNIFKSFREFPEWLL